MQESGALHHKYRAKFCGQTSRKSSFRYRKTEHHNAVPRFICFMATQVIAELGATSKKQMGRVMGALGKATGGNFDKPAAAKIVGAKLAYAPADT